MEMVSEMADMAATLPSERILKAVAKAVTCTEVDVASAKALVHQVAPANWIGDLDDASATEASEAELNQFWQTSAGRFKFSLEELPDHLQLIYGFLKELYHVIRPDTQRNLLCCIEILCLRCEAISKSAKEHLGFVIWVQENLSIGQLWNLVSSATSHVAQTVRDPIPITNIDAIIIDLFRYTFLPLGRRCRCCCTSSHWPPVRTSSGRSWTLISAITTGK